MNGLENKSGTEPLIKIEHLKKYFDVPGKGELHAVDDISLEIMPYETLGLVGESGCGKSMTSLSCMKLQPSLAAVRLDGETLRSFTVS